MQERLKEYSESHFKDTGIPNLSSKHPKNEDPDIYLFRSPLATYSRGGGGRVPK